MANLELTRLVSQIEKLVTDNEASGFENIEERKYTLAYLIGGVIGLKLPLPSSPVDNLRIYYASSVYPAVADLVGQINESYVIDTDAALKAANHVWSDRYRLVHQPMIDARALITRISTINESYNWQSNSKEDKDLSKVATIISSQEAKNLDNIFITLFKQLEDNQ